MKSAIAPKLFGKGGAMPLFRKSGQVLSDLSPVLGLVNPSLGIASAGIGRVLSKF